MLPKDTRESPKLFKGEFFQSLILPSFPQCIVNVVEKLLRLLVALTGLMEGGWERVGQSHFSPTNLQAPSLAACD